MLSQDLIVTPTTLVPTAGQLPAIIQGSGRKARDRIEHFLRAAIDNDNTRRAYGRALGSFFAFLEDGGRERVQDIGPLDVRDYLEAAKANGLSTATLKQHMAAVRMLFDHLVTGGVIEHNPALSVKAPREKLGKGKTPVLTAEEAGELLRSIESDTVTGLRDRALIGVMVFTFARVSAACGLNVADIFHQQRRLWVRLHEKGGKFHEMPCHHTLESYLTEYIEHARLGEAGRVPVFQDHQGSALRPWRGNPKRRAAAPNECLADGASTGQGGSHRHRGVQPHLPGHRDYSLPRERRHARKGTPDGGACLHPHHSALRSARGPRHAR
jgi:site-specific recombinase XerD